MNAGLDARAVVVAEDGMLLNPYIHDAYLVELSREDRENREGDNVRLRFRFQVGPLADRSGTLLATRAACVWCQGWLTPNIVGAAYLLPVDARDRGWSVFREEREALEALLTVFSDVTRVLMFEPVYGDAFAVLLRAGAELTFTPHGHPPGGGEGRQGGAAETP